MTQREISAEFLILNGIVEQIAGEDLPDAKREAVRTLASSAMRLLEGVLIDLNRITDALEVMAADSRGKHF